MRTLDGAWDLAAGASRLPRIVVRLTSIEPDRDLESPSAAISSCRRAPLAGQLVPLPARNLGSIAGSVKI